ncbi:MAG: hypothetical protein JWP37_1002 [Mucilaginibacter sp.]|nr:hypothetical protein [Mucilaginibacter sp.]
MGNDIESGCHPELVEACPLACFDIVTVGLASVVVY